MALLQFEMLFIVVLNSSSHHIRMFNTETKIKILIWVTLVSVHLPSDDCT
uniref:Uncharacterized protein n=1 Tax=Aegilops tauschii subsp. strangulata TaxID=200361 RepID=A0A453FA43_AEGTS